MAWGLIMQRVQFEKEAVFFPMKLLSPKKKFASCKSKQKERNFTQNILKEYKVDRYNVTLVLPSTLNLEPIIPLKEHSSIFQFFSISLYIINTDSNINAIIKEMTIHSRISWLLNKFSLSVLWEMYREKFKENVHTDQCLMLNWLLYTWTHYWQLFFIFLTKGSGLCGVKKELYNY